MYMFHILNNKNQQTLERAEINLSVPQYSQKQKEHLMCPSRGEKQTQSCVCED